MRSSSSSSSGSYDLKDAMADPNNDLDHQVAPHSEHVSETELDRDVSSQGYKLAKISLFKFAKSCEDIIIASSCKILSFYLLEKIYYSVST